MNQERQREKEREERFDKMEKWTNLAWPTPGDSDVPPAEERANRIYTYTCILVRAEAKPPFAGTTIVGTIPGLPSLSLSFSAPTRLPGVQQRVDDAIMLTGHRESAGRDAIVRNDEERGSSLTAKSSLFLV